MKSTQPARLSSQALTWISILAAAGLVISWVQTFHFFEVRSGQAGFHSFCQVGQAFDCNAIDASPYAELFAGLPLSSAAAGWFLAILGLSLLARSAEFAGVMYPWVLGMAALGSLTSILYLGIMVAILRVGCLLCIGVDLINWVMLGILWISRPRGTGRPAGLPTTGAWVTALSLGLTLVLAKGSQGEAPARADVADRIQSIISAPATAIHLPEGALSAGGTQATAKVTIVKFSDFQCPSCRVGAQTLHPVLKRFGDRVRFVYRNFPLDASCNRLIKSAMHPFACELARGAVCAGVQGRFQQYYESIFERQKELKAGSALETARVLGLDTAAFETCLKDPATAAKVSADIEEAIALNVESTPTFFVNGRRATGAQPPEVWNAVLEQLLR